MKRNLFNCVRALFILTFIYPMTTPFLKLVAQKVLDHGMQQWHRCAVVLPARRSVHYFRNYLLELAHGPFVAPEITVLPDWISSHAQVQIAPQDTLLLMLYEAYCSVTIEKPDTFANFLKWGPSVLSDFADIDLALLSDQTIFTDLRNVAEIENWSFHQNTLTTFQQQYLDFWNVLPSLYRSFTSLQDATGEYSYGYAVKKALRQTNAGNHDFTWFIGFSSIRKAEDELFSRLKKEGRASLVLDSDVYFEKASPWHEAGAFMRTRNPSEKYMSDNFRLVPKDIEVIHCSSPLAEIEAAVRIIGAMSEDQLEETGVVLMHDTLLESLLRRMPPLAKKVNIAMDLPVTATQLWPAMATLFKLPTHNSQGAILLENVDSLFHSQVLTSILGTSTQAYTSYCQQRKLRHLRPEHITELTAGSALGKRTLDLFFPPNATQFLEVICSVLEQIALQLPQTIEAFSAIQLHTAAVHLTERIEKHLWLNDVTAATALLRHYARASAISFQHEPQEQLQIMSMTETRALDMKQWIFIGASDQLLPGKHSSASIIPFDLRKFYKLPIPEDAEATFAYTFYRAIARSQKIYLLYSNQTKGIQTEEPSRYIAQLKKELPTFHPEHRLTEYTFGFPTRLKQHVHVEIPNSEAIRTKLAALVKKGISPSALNKFLQCPLDFYYRYIAGLGEKEEVEENMGTATFGSIVHKVLEDCYTPFIGKSIAAVDVENMKQRVPHILNEAVKEHLSEELVAEGYNALAIMVIERMIASLLEAEKHTFNDAMATNQPRTVQAIEQPLLAQCTVASHYFSEINIRGFADRIDKQDQMSMIIDYKTGNVDSADVTIDPTTMDVLFGSKKPKALQLAMYCWMMYKQGVPPQNIQAGLVSLRAISRGYQWFSIKEKNTLDADWMQWFEQSLVSTIDSIWELDVFRHNPKATMCEYCSRS